MRKGILLLILSMIFLVGCNKEYTVPEVKRYDPDIYKEDFVFSENKGTLKEPVEYYNVLNVSGELYKNKNEMELGDFGVEVERVYRGDAAKFRLADQYINKKLEKGSEWMLVVLNVYNFYDAEDKPLTFNKGDIGIYTKKGKSIPVLDVGDEREQQRVSIYKLESQKVHLPLVIDKKEKDLYVGVNKLVKEFKMEDLDEDGNLIESEDENLEELVEAGKEDVSGEEKDKKDTKDKKDKEEESLIRYISIKDFQVIKEFNLEDDIEDDKGSKIEVIE